MRENKVLKTLSILFSVLTSLILSGLSFYLVYLKIYWFIGFGLYFLIDAFVSLIASNKKDRYDGMKSLGNWQAFSVVVMMVFLLTMILWDDKDGLMPYQASYIVLGVVIGIKALFAIIAEIDVHRYYQPIIHAHRNQYVIQALILATLLGLVITNQYYPGSGEGLLKEKPLWIYIIDISVNGISTLIVAFLALSTVVRAKVREEMTTTGKIKHLAKWMNENEVSMFFGLIFTAYLTALALMNIKVDNAISVFYIFLAAYYVIIGGIRLINYLWHRTIIHSSTNKINENRHSSWILLFNAVAYTLFSDVIAIGAIMLMTNKVNVGTNIYLFLFITIPFGILKFILAIRAIRINRRNNDTYRMGLGYIALISAMFSLLEVIAISVHGLDNIFKYFAIISSVVVVKVFVLVIAVTFVVHWIRSLIINRSSKEKQVYHKK